MVLLSLYQRGSAVPTAGVKDFLQEGSSASVILATRETIVI